MRNNRIHLGSDQKKCRDIKYAPALIATKPTIKLMVYIWPPAGRKVMKKGEKR
jgi:hypothetical protein